MTPSITILQTREENFALLASQYGGLAQNDFIPEIERAVYEDVAALLDQISDRFQRGVIEMDEQSSFPFVRAIPIASGPVEHV